MSAAATLFLAFSMSMDAFAASLAKGAVLNRPRFSEALRTGFIFGVVEAITPVIGWVGGIAAAAWINRVDHWVAFVILGLLGARMVFKAICHTSEKPAPARHSLGLLLVTAVATSLDAMAVGVSLAFINVDIITTAAAIGLATFMMATIGTVFGRGAEVLGGICLIGIGAKILFDHLSAT
jgi:putative Mn2+ efflux pump MntP